MINTPETDPETAPPARGDDRAMAPYVIDERWFQDARRALQANSEPFPAARACALLRRQYGLDGTARTLNSEAETTVLIEQPNGGRLILKSASRPAALDSFRFQSAALAGLETQPGIVAPRLLRTISGGLMFSDDGWHGYVQSCIEGTPLAAAADPTTLHASGAALARLDRALARVTPPAANRPVLWNIRCWPRLSSLLHYLPAGKLATQVAAAMRHYAECIQPALEGLAWQVTHNDPSPFNIFVTGSDIAFIDFGDGGWAPRVQDLAVVASHFVTDPARPLGGAEALISGYASVLPLSDLEVRLLPGLIAARQAVLVLINAWRASLFPAEAAYINKNVARAAGGLAILSALGSDEAEAIVRDAASDRLPEPPHGESSPHGD